jgi:hypothetical protein
MPGIKYRITNMVEGLERRRRRRRSVMTTTMAAAPQKGQENREGRRNPCLYRYVPPRHVFLPLAAC